MQLINVNDNIRLEMLSLSMAQTVFDAIDKERETLSKWLPFVEMTREVSDTENFIRSISSQKTPARDIVYVIFVKNEFAGLIGIKEIDWMNKKTELGYWMIAGMEGKGIMTDCVRKLIKYSFTALKLNRVQIKVAVGNEKSEAIPKRLGFCFEGIEREGELHQQKFLNLKVFSLIKSDSLL